MKQTPEQLFEQLSKEFAPKKEKEVINEELGGVVELKPINKIEPTTKEPFWTKFESFLAENSLEPIVNNDMKFNTKEGDEKIKNAESKYSMDNKLAGSYKVSSEVENIASHNYDYDPSVDNINNVNAQEVLTGIQCEINYNKELTLDEAKELAVKNLAKDPLHYVKEGQFGVKGLGYTEQKVEENSGETYGGSGYSEKVKEGDDAMQIVKEDKDCCPKEQINEALGQVVTTGNPFSLAALSGQVIKDMMAEKEEKSLPMDEMEDEGTAVSYSDTMEEKKDHDGDGDIDSDDYLAARDKAIKKAMGKKPKKESIETKLAEIGKAGEITKMEAQLEFLHNHINEKIDRLSSINEDENLAELVDKKKMKDMQKEIKLLEKRKGKMEKMYEKMAGKKYQQTEVVDEAEEIEEMDAVSYNEKNNPTRSKAVGERDPKKVGQSTSAYAVNLSEARFPEVRQNENGEVIDATTKAILFDPNKGDSPMFRKLMDRAIEEPEVGTAFKNYLKSKNIDTLNLGLATLKREFGKFKMEVDKGNDDDLKNRLKVIDFFAADDDNDFDTVLKDLKDKALSESNKK